MDVTIRQKLARWTQPSFFWLSVLIHLFIFLMIFYWHLDRDTPSSAIPVPEKQESYYYYTPAYTPTQPAPAANTQPKTVKEVAKLDKKFDLSEMMVRKENKQLFKKSAIDTDLIHNTVPSDQTKYMEPIRMVGEKLLDDPFQMLLGRAITAQLYYPEMARGLHMHGTAGIGFVLHPDGTITNARIVQTSKENILDVAALNTVKNASPIANVDIYVKEAKYLVIHIIY